MNKYDGFVGAIYRVTSGSILFVYISTAVFFIYSLFWAYFFRSFVVTISLIWIVISLAFPTEQRAPKAVR